MMASKRAVGDIGEGNPQEEPEKKKSNAGRPKSLPKLDPKHQPKIDEIIVAIATLQENYDEPLTELQVMNAIKKKFMKDGKPDLEAAGGEGILKFLDDERDRIDKVVVENLAKFTEILAEYKKDCRFEVQEDSVLSSLRNADFTRLMEHERFIEVIQVAIKYYKYIYQSDQTVDAKRDRFIRTSIRELKVGVNKAARDLARVAQSQVAPVVDNEATDAADAGWQLLLGNG